MSVNFASDNGFCNCGAELMSWFEVEDGCCSLCSGTLTPCFDCGEPFDPTSETNLFCDDCLNKGL